MIQKDGLSFAVCDAVDDIKSSVDVVTKSNGGYGAVREMVEYILKKDNQKELKELWV